MAKLTAAHIHFFQNQFAESCFLDADQLHQYGHDETENLQFTPEILLKPKNTEEVSQMLKYCNQNQLPVTPCGARTGLSGGALAIHGGVLMSMERFDKILEIDKNNLQVCVEPGVITQVLQNAVKAEGLFYPPDPASKGSCFIGGNIAENSGGPKAVKYGVTANYVLNLELVLPNGEIIWTGANVLKNATGYNLTQLIVGSEGTLGVVTKIVLRLLPHPTKDLLMLVPFFSATEACRAVPEIFKRGIIPSAMEFMERDALLWTLQFVDDSPVQVADNHQAHLLIELDGWDENVLFQDCEKIYELLADFDCDEPLVADTQAQKDALWTLRRKAGEAVKLHSIYKEEDTVVPRYHLPDLLQGVKEIGAKYGFKSVCYGHAGDGNLHINIIKGDLTDEFWQNELRIAIREIFTLTVQLGGTISGEHGIGYVQKEFMDIAFNEVQLNLMQQIKHIFDPNGIMNPGKVFPGE
jgi:glycolate oxidase